MFSKYEDGYVDNTLAFISNLFSKNSERKMIEFLKSILLNKRPLILIQTKCYNMQMITEKLFDKTMNSLSSYRKKQLMELVKTNDTSKNKIAISVFLYFLNFGYSNVFFEILNDGILINGCDIKIERLF